MYMTKTFDAIVNDLKTQYGSVVSRAQILEYQEANGLDYLAKKIRDAYPSAGRGLYQIDGTPAVTPTVAKSAKPVTVASTPPPVVTAEAISANVVADNAASMSFTMSKSTTASDLTQRIAALASEASLLSSVPAKSKAFVPFGEYETIRTIIASRVFCPFFITGHSGNGKTFGVQQACAAEGREYVRVNITAETDEDDLIGGFRLKNGETVFELGPVPVAMLRGAVLMLDEIDLAGAKVMCLQPVLEGQPLLIKKLGVTIHPAQGFTVFATANTKGRGSEDGKYIGTNLLNEAFLERFNATIEQDYPGVAVEKKILAKTYETLGGTMTASETVFFETLAKWADAIRVTFNEGGIEDLITTRRLCHIVKLYRVFGHEQRALTLGLNRFDKQVQQKFLDFYAKLDPRGADTTPSPNADSAAVTDATTANF